MHSDRYVHPEFGLLSPTPRLRRELRMAFFSVLFGIGIGAATVIALSGNKTADDARVSGVSSVSVKSEQPTEAVLGYNRQREAEIDNEVMDRTSKSDGTKDQANSENRKTDATTTCEGNNLSCGNIPPRASRSRAMRIPAASGALAIGRAPLGRPDGSTGMTSASATSEAHPAEAEGGAEARLSSNSLMDQKPYKIARRQNRPRQDAASYRDHRAASRIGRGYNRPAGELDRAYALDRSYGSRGFWDWSR